MLEYLMQNKKLIPVIGGISLILVVGLLWSFVFKTPAYSFIVDGQVKFAVVNQDQVKQEINKIKQQEEQKCNKDLEIASQVEFKKGLVKRSSIIKTESLPEKLRQVLEFKVMGAELVVDGKIVACVDSKTTAEQLLSQIKNTFGELDEGEKLVELNFEEDIEINEKMVEVNEVMSGDEAYTLITTGTKNPEKYIVEEGDSLWLIARRNDMYVDEIVQANKLTTENLSLGQELILVKSKPYITVLAKVEGEKVEKIPFETKVVVDNSAANSVRVKQNGKDGEKHIVYVATKRNGVIEEREIKKETILEKAVDKIIVKGNQVTVASRGTGGSGNLDWPVSGSITKRFAGTHTGVDIANKSGTSIKAVESGTVTFAGWQGNYGRFLIIDHGNGLVTRYAHCNTLNASVGQTVSQGETIATVGSTGRSSGPHLHFEVLVNGGFRNPLSYLR